MDNLVSAIIASILTAVFSFFIIKWQTARNERKLEQATLKAIYTEIKTLNQFYIGNLSNVLATKGNAPQIVDAIWPGGHHYFQVYTNHSTTLGTIEDEEIRTRIIKTYITAMSLVDGLCLNSEMLNEWKQLQRQLPKLGVEGTPIVMEKERLLARLEDYGEKLRENAIRFRKESDALLALLEKILRNG